MPTRTLLSGVLCLGLLAQASTSAAAPIYASNLVAWNNVTVFGSGLVTGAPDGGGLWLGSSVDPPALLGSLTVSFATALANGAGTDLVVVDVGSSSNETFNVEVSTNGLAFTLVGAFSATSNQIDFGGFADPVSFVRLTNTSQAVSADIDAIYGNYEAARVPEPSSFILGAFGLAALVSRRRRRV